MIDLNNKQDEYRERVNKYIVLVITIAISFFILFLRLFWLQVIKAEQNIALSRENQMKLRIIKAPRGIIYDRNGIVLARNRPSYSICILPYNTKNLDSLISNLLKIRDSNGEPVFDSLKLVKRIKKALYRKFDITRLKEDVSIDIVSVIEEHSEELPGILIKTEARREYPFGKETFHILGYLTELSEKEFDRLKDSGYVYGDKIGRAGIEKQYESLLRGKDGKEYVEVNAYGKVLGPVENMPRIDPVPGKNLYLSIDWNLQKVAAQAFPDSLKGAVVAINPQTGEVLVMYSSPSPDPNIFSLATSLRVKSWAEVAMDTAHPLNNRAVTGVYPPGSTFKLVSGLAGVASGKVNPNTYMPQPCRGAFRFGNRIAHCWYSKGHSYLKMADAIKVSCNVYFYQLGLMVGDSIINYYAKMLGLGQKTGIDLPIERSGWLSGKDAYNRRFSKRGWKWTKGLVLDLAIGQTQLVTPLQLAVTCGSIANGKKNYKPFLLKEVRLSDGTLIKTILPSVLHEFSIDSNSISVIKTAMIKVVEEPGGTGRRAQVKGITVGGKSGSAENPHGEKTHGLFVAAAPMENPEISVAAVVENGGHGGTVAAPIVGAILRKYFKNKKENENAN